MLVCLLLYNLVMRKLPNWFIGSVSAVVIFTIIFVSVGGFYSGGENPGLLLVIIPIFYLIRLAEILGSAILTYLPVNFSEGIENYISLVLIWAIVGGFLGGIGNFKLLFRKRSDFQPEKKLNLVWVTLTIIILIGILLNFL